MALSSSPLPLPHPLTPSSPTARYFTICVQIHRQSIFGKSVRKLNIRTVFRFDFIGFQLVKAGNHFRPCLIDLKFYFLAVIRPIRQCNWWCVDMALVVLV
jgi:hypothetical protein